MQAADRAAPFAWSDFNLRSVLHSEIVRLNSFNESRNLDYRSQLCACSMGCSPRPGHLSAAHGSRGAHRVDARRLRSSVHVSTLCPKPRSAPTGPPVRIRPIGIARSAQALATLEGFRARSTLDSIDSAGLGCSSATSQGSADTSGRADRLIESRAKRAAVAVEARRRLRTRTDERIGGDARALARWTKREGTRSTHTPRTGKRQPVCSMAHEHRS